MGGCNIMMALAIDFTGSNLDWKDPESLHTLDMSKWECHCLERNQYIQAIHAVGNILQAYDTDKNIPVFGYGAKLPFMRDAQHCFALNGNIFAPEVYTIANVERLYTTNVSKLGFRGPTNFAPIITYIGNMAEYYVRNRLVYNYIVLLMLTDGDITDPEETIDTIVKYSRLPLSIVIVGVGNNKFAEMEILDADKGPLRSPLSGQSAVRDIVQFVPFTQFAANHAGLAEATLKEIPLQLVDYMTEAKIAPCPSGTIQPTGPSYYDTRRQQFEAIATPATQRPKQDVIGLLNIGFPSEDVNEFVNCLSQKYINELALKPA